MQNDILLIKLNSIELSLDGNKLMKTFMKGGTSDFLALDIILIKSALSPSPAFIGDFNILRFLIFYSQFDKRNKT